MSPCKVTQIIGKKEKLVGVVYPEKPIGCFSQSRIKVLDSLLGANIFVRENTPNFIYQETHSVSILTSRTSFRKFDFIITAVSAEEARRLKYNL